MDKKNPLRYRGYYYDTETGMYYLQSRYYNPETCRFISRDDTQYHEGNTGVKANLYAYCDNNPVMNVDPDGKWPHFGKHRYNSDKIIGIIIDIIILAIPALWGIASYFRAKRIAQTAAKIAARLSRKTLRKAFEKLTIRIAKKTGLNVIKNVCNTLINIIFVICATSFGQLIAKGLDYIDGRYDGYVFA